MTRVLVAGATGAIGRALTAELVRRGNEVVGLSRDPDTGGDTGSVRMLSWPEPKRSPPPEAALAAADAVVNLLGEPIAQRWTTETKQEIRDSRVLGTRSLVQGIKSLAPEQRPHVFVSQSATGYYGPRGDELLDEDAPPGSDFLAQVVTEWEREALAAEKLTRVVLTRTGVVLAADSGALAQMLGPFRLGIGGPVAGGRQYVSWIHLDDVVGGLITALETESLRGPVNLTAPDPVTNRELSKALGRVLGRPAVLPVPAAALRIAYGEMAQVVTTGQRVVPSRLLETGYRFRQPDLEAALHDLLDR